jgi:malate dehydrogenase (oxaloacetate-decarboxylating)
MNSSVSPDDYIQSLPADFSEADKAAAKTLFLREVSLLAHRYYQGKIQTLPACCLYGFDWFNVWYTPGVSAVSTTIRDDNNASFELSRRGNMVAVVSDSTRVLGDGDCTPPGGLGVMEGKALLMKYLGGIDAVPLCIDSRREGGSKDPGKIIDFVKMVQPSFGAINLEDISQPGCFRVLDELRSSCDIPVWHDDAQGTATIVLAALINALSLAGKKLSEAKIVLLGAGASNTSVAELILADGGNPERLVLLDEHGGLHRGRADMRDNPLCYRQWRLCGETNPERIDTPGEALKGADVLIAFSRPGPDTVRKEWIASMAEKSIVFACANPVPEIWPHDAKDAGAYIVATGRGDFPNQVNNSVCFPGILKGALLCRARKITDTMAVGCAHSIAEYTRETGLSSERIVPSMSDTEVFAREAADITQIAAAEGVARISLSREDAYTKAFNDILLARKSSQALAESGCIPDLPPDLLRRAFDKTVAEIRNERRG